MSHDDPPLAGGRGAGSGNLATLNLIFDRVVDGLAAFAAILLLFVMLSVSADVVGRYFLDRPIGWVLEINEYVLLYVPFLGMAWLARRADGHVRIDILLNALPPRPRSLLNAATLLLAAGTCAVACWWALATTWDQFARDTYTVGIYPIPKFIPVSVIGVGFSLTAIQFLKQAAAHVRAKPGGRAE